MFENREIAAKTSAEVSARPKSRLRFAGMQESETSDWEKETPAVRQMRNQPGFGSLRIDSSDYLSSGLIPIPRRIGYFGRLGGE